MNYRKIVEKNIGRKLKSNEIIHHIDGNQHNNHISNLKIIKSHREHLKLKTREVNITSNDINQMIEIMKEKESLNFHQSLLMFFSPRQIEIIYRKLKNLPLSKTEREMYSRSIIKKVRAISNRQLIDLANRIL